MSKHQDTVVVDFDNTIAGYDHWRGEKVIGPPVPYAISAIREYQEWGWRVVVFTTRGNIALVREWLTDHFFDGIEINTTDHNPPGCSNKPIGTVYHDDRDAHCVGHVPYNWHKAMRRVTKLYQPPLDTHIDDAQSWGSYLNDWLIGHRNRRLFRQNLSVFLDAEQARQEGHPDVADAILNGFYREQEAV